MLTEKKENMVGKDLQKQQYKLIYSL